VQLDRNGLGILDEEECWQLLAAHHVGRLAVCIAGVPEIFPLNFVVDSRTLVVLTSPGTKLAGAVLGGRVAFEIDAADPLFHTGWSVVLHGSAEEIEDLEELMAVQQLPLRPWGPLPKSNWVRITPSTITGRRILPAGVERSG